MKEISLLGASGSVGESTLKVIKRFPEVFHLRSFSVHKSLERAKSIIDEYSPTTLVVTDPDVDPSILGEKYGSAKILYGFSALDEIVSEPRVDIVVTAIVGSRGIYPTLKAIACDKKIAIANKETLVTLGPYIKNLLRKSESLLVPVDSEHNALFQLLEKWERSEIQSITLTASGGSFRDLSNDQLANVSIKDTLNHPTWKMGPKITVDSAGLINKSLEVIEAHFLFDIPYENIDVVIHPESIVHGYIELLDGSSILYASHPDMIYPIAHSLFYPKPTPSTLISRKLPEVQNLSFREVDHQKYPALRLAYEVGKKGGTGPALFNAANEVAVERFLKGEIRFIDIPKIIDKVIQKIPIILPENLDGYLHADSLARKTASETKE